VTLTRVSIPIAADARRRIVYQGEPGSNSHLACQQRFPDLEPVATASFEDCFAAVENGEADLAMIPIDNSVAGRVADIHHFLPTSPLHIVGEHFLRVRFALLGIPGATLDGVKTVHSHAHALGQCRRVIREHGFTPVISGDTAGAAREVKEADDPTQAAISPLSCARWPSGSRTAPASRPRRAPRPPRRASPHGSSPCSPLPQQSWPSSPAPATSDRCCAPLSRRSCSGRP